MTSARTFQVTAMLLVVAGALGCTDATAVPSQGSTTAPTDSNPPTIAPTDSSPPVEYVDLKGITGAYEVEARITSFDDWGSDLTGSGYAGVLTFHAQSDSTGGRIGTFENFRWIDANGVADPWSVNSGAISRERNGFELAGEYFHWKATVDSIAEPVGDPAASPLFEGTFFTGAAISGTFTAKRIAGQ